MTNKEIISMVKNNIHGYESISLANDDVERLFVVIKRIQKQSDLLTLGLLQEKNKARKLKEALQNLVNDVFAGRTLMPTHLYAYKQATKALLEANPEEKPLGTEMADIFDKIIEPSEPKFCICCEEITEENAHLHRNCGK